MKKGFVDWLSHESPDVICIQETKANKGQVDFALIEDLGYNTCLLYTSDAADE